METACRRGPAPHLQRRNGSVRLAQPARKLLLQLLHLPFCGSGLQMIPVSTFLFWLHDVMHSVGTSSMKGGCSGNKREPQLLVQEKLILTAANVQRASLLQ